MQHLFAFARQVKSNFEDALNLFFVVFEHFVHVTPPGIVYALGLGAKVKTTYKFSNDHEINALANDFRTQR